MSPPERFIHLAEMADRLGVPLSPEVMDRLDRFVSLLLRWNARINLTGASSETDVVIDHLPDALALAAIVPPGSPLLDVGAGGGLPGLPFAILRPDFEVTLLEPRSRRTAFLRAAVHELGLRNAQVVEGRLDPSSAKLPAPLPTRVPCAASRATFQPEEWLALGRRIVRPGGGVFLFLTTSPPAAWGSPAQVIEYSAGADRKRVLAEFRSAPEG